MSFKAPAFVAALFTVVGCGVAPEGKSVADWNVSTELGQVLPSPWQMTLDMGQLVPGDTTTFEVSGANPGDTITLLRGSPGTSCPGVLDGLCIDVTGPSVMLNMVADDFGVASASVALPLSLPLGIEATFQAVGGVGDVAYSSNTETRIISGGAVAEDPNLLVDGGFDVDVAGWASDAYLTVDWSGEDRLGDASSGAMLATLDTTDIMIHEITTCMPVEEAAFYDLSLWGFPEAEASGVLYWNIGYEFFSGADCTGSLTRGDVGWYHVGRDWAYHELPDVPVEADAQAMNFRIRVWQKDTTRAVDFTFDDASVIAHD